jgi:hypothetical protein
MNKIFVGTMYSGEGDFDECKKSINSQDNVVIEHVVIENLPEKEAHNALWESWRLRRSNDFKAFVKIDADTVLSHNNVLSSFVKMLSENERVTGIQAPLRDYFTDDMINGLNCFTPKVTFRDTSDDLFCDRNVDVDHDIVIKADGVISDLRPAGLHCYFSSEIQAFHFGVHRALKGQHGTIEKVKHAWIKHKDKLRGLAILGAQHSPKFSKKRDFNYTDKTFVDAFEQALSTYENLRPNK